MRYMLVVSMLLTLIGLAACATNPQDRGQWHEYLHDHGWE